MTASVRPLARLAGVAAAAALLCAAPAARAGLKLADSFRVGSSGVLCTAQSRVADPALAGLFDRGYQLVCRDASTPVGKLLALRTEGPGAGAAVAARLVAARPADATCAAPVAGDIPALPDARLTRCTAAGLAWSAYEVTRGNTHYAAIGLAGYGSVLRLGLRALVADAPVNGEVEVAATEAGDPAAFARIQAGSLDPGQALTEGYVRNNAASFAEASEFFDLLVERSRQGQPGFNHSAEYLANLALQQSNLGNFAEADALFARADHALDPADSVVVRLIRNFRAMHEMNRRRPAAALTELERAAPVDTAGLDRDRVATGYIDVPLAQKLNSDDRALRGLAGVGSTLSPSERAAILDAQALYLRGAAERSLGRDAPARADLAAALVRLDAVRQGRVTSADWLRAGVATELAILQERAGQAADARASLTAATVIYARDYPDSAALLMARARLAALLARQGATAESAALYRSVIKAAPATPGAGQAVRGLVGPYFGLLADGGSGEAGDFFDASQILVRPGVAQTQAVLARELSGGSDVAAGLFRQSLTLSRDILRADGDIAALTAKPEPGPDDAATIAALRARREALGRDQTAVLSQLSDVPRYRSITNNVVTLADLQGQLHTGEAYYKLVLVGNDAYALFATAAVARVLRVGASTAELGAMVRALRDSIVRFDEFGRPRTDPFDAATARRLYHAMFDPVDAEMPAVRHLIFEPDGPLLQLPVNLLITDDKGLADYARHVAADDDQAYDMRGIAWLGRSRMVSTAVSPRSFLDVRAIPASTAPRSYLGLGQNAIPAGVAPKLTLASERRTRGAVSEATPAPAAARDRCDWPLKQWANPISPAELEIGARLIGHGTAEVVTGAAFNDTALMARTDLRQFRVIHFATHGLVTAPRPECPARPALLTSFGGGDSDGLLSFAEIFDLTLDADTIILSACDTAGTATAAATREAGIATGGNFALDGLVRAFVGAGARAVIASHWPVPDDYGATRTLITGLFTDAARTSVGEALRASQVTLMDAADTSHPYYWSGFAIVGDAAKPLASAAVAPAAPGTAR